jgi:O-antigen/teichoic acid export membrane protein
MTEAHGRGDREGFRSLSAAGAGIGVILFVCGALFSLSALALPWDGFLHIHDAQAAREAPALVAVLLLIGATGVAMSSIESIFAARLEVVKPRICATAASVVSFGLLLLGVRLRVSLPLLAALMAAPPALYRTPMLIELLRKEPALLRPSWADLRPALATLVPVSLLYLGIQASNVVMSSLPSVVIARELSLEHVAVWSVAARAVGVPLSLVSAMVPIVWPAFTLAWTRGERTWLRSRLALALKGTAAALVGFVIFLGVAGPRLILWWTHGKAVVAPSVLLALGCWLLVQASVHWLSTFLHAITDFRFELFCFVGSAALTALLAFAVTRPFGLPGLALSIAAALALGSLVPMALRVRRKLSSAAG